MNAIAPHHQRAIDRSLEHFRADPRTIAVILAGSIAKGQQTDGSDVDMMVVLDDAAIEERRQQNRLSECIWTLCDYQGGYVDVKYFAKDFLSAAAERGSEPTRNSFIGARCLWSRDPQIAPLLEGIPVYPRHAKTDKILSFYAGLMLNQGFFWGEAQKRNDPYLRIRVVGDVALFGCRLILAHNERLFPCQKRLVEATDACPDKPPAFRASLERMLAAPTDETVRGFAKLVFDFRDWGIGTDYSKPLTRFVEDHEQWWWRQRPYIAEW